MSKRSKQTTRRDSQKNKGAVTPQPSSRTETTTVSTSRTRTRRHEREIRKRQQRIRMMIAGAIILAAVIAGVLIYRNMPASAPIPEGTLDRYDGLPKSVNEDGFPVLGNPNAPVRVEEYSSFSCPACAVLHDESKDAIVERVRAGIISVTFVPMVGIGSVPNSQGATQAALCAGQQGHFFEFADTLFSWQQQFGNRAFTQNRLRSGIENLGLNTSLYGTCTGSSTINNTISAAAQRAREREISSTPTVYVNGLIVEPSGNAEALLTAIDNALATSGLEPVPISPVDAPITVPEITPESTAEVELPDPEVTEQVELPVAEETPES